MAKNRILGQNAVWGYFILIKEGIMGTLTQKKRKSIFWTLEHPRLPNSRGIISPTLTLMCRFEEKRAAHWMRGFKKAKICCNFPQLDTSGLVTLKYSISKLN